VVCPLVDGSDKVQAASAVEEAERLATAELCPDSDAVADWTAESAAIATTNATELLLMTAKYDSVLFMSRQLTVNAEASAGSVALVHDFLIDYRGGERVFKVLCDLFPNADVYSPIFDAEGTRNVFADRAVRASYLNKLAPKESNFRRLLPFYPRATESLDLSGYDLIISSSSAWAHGLIAREGQRHLSYCHNPFRYAWDQRQAAMDGRGFIARGALDRVLSRWRAWDRAVSAEVDLYLANGEITRERIARCFGRSSGLLYPPVDTDRFSLGNSGEQFVVLSELMPHKRIDVIVSAFSDLGMPLTVIGDGPDLARLFSLSGPSVEFAGRVSDDEVAQRLQSSAALVQCATEEFGIASVEAQAAGRPVLALAEGGALETVVPGVTGQHFAAPDVEALKSALSGFDPGDYAPSDCVANAERFSISAFSKGITDAVASLGSVPDAPRLRQHETRRGLWRAGIA
jgi:glycosyltransferase involved in cell wall biosynthesis